MPPPKKTAAQRVAAHRERMAALGVRQLVVMVHDDDRERVQAYARRLLAKRTSEARVST